MSEEAEVQQESPRKIESPRKMESPRKLDPSEAKPEGPPPEADDDARRGESRERREKARDYVELKREKRPHKPGKPPSLDEQDMPTGEVRLRDLDQTIEEEMEAALADFDAQMAGDEKTAAEAARGPKVKPGEKRGVVVSVHGDDVFVDIPGGRSQGVMSAMQFDDGPPAVGTMVDYVIQRYDPQNGLLVLGKPGAAERSVDWDSVSRGMVVEARVLSTNKGGLSVEVNGIRGFMPISQIDLYRTENVEQFVNRRLKCVISEVDPADRNLVVSRRELLEREREEAKAKFWETIEEGQTRPGLVKLIKDFGIFVDLGGADGLVPISELSWARVGHPSQLVNVGDKIEVKVMRIDREAERITLSLRQLGGDPLEEFAQEASVGSVIEGKVSRLADFGAFVELRPGLEGLVHISELSSSRARRVRDAVSEGQIVNVQILEIDKERRRVALSLKGAVALAEQEAAEKDRAEPAAKEAAEPERPKKPKKKDPDLRGGLGGGGPLFKLPGQ